MTTNVARRDLMNLVGRAGGATAIYRTLAAMGLAFTSPSLAAPPQLPSGSGAGVSVVILGAGIAGMTAAYELRKAGYQCTILEARDRPGGRVWTLRGGDRVTETDSIQTVNWDKQSDLYFNAGASRISHHHQGILSYCRELNVDLQLFATDNRAGLMQSGTGLEGKPQPAQRIDADLRGAIAALAAKSLPPGPPAIRELVQLFGGLQNDMTYTGSTRAGYVVPPGAGSQSGTPYAQQLALDDIAQAMQSENLLDGLLITEIWEQSSTMLQPVGGMDAIPRAFAASLGSMITYDSEVTRIGRNGDRVRIDWRHRETGQAGVTLADYALVTIPLPVLTSIEADFSPPIKSAINAGAKTYIPAVKVAFQSDQRWWESDHSLYGGISWTSGDITQIWYPSHGFHGKKGILTSAYIWTPSIGDRFAAMTPAERNAAAINGAERIHPGFGSRVSRGISVAWSKIPFSLGGWAEWDTVTRAQAYPILVAGEGPFLFAGEHLSYINGWQEGAVQSAHYALALLAQKVKTRHT